MKQKKIIPFFLQIITHLQPNSAIIQYFKQEVIPTLSLLFGGNTSSLNKQDVWHKNNNVKWNYTAGNKSEFQNR